MNSLAEDDLLERIRRYGRFDANGCMNCGTCSIVCDLSTGRTSFPRRALQRALMGLRTSLVREIDPWLCHDCGDCSRLCPRQAEPRESLMTLRRYLAGQYDVTGISARILRSGAWHVGTLAAAALLFLAVVAAYHLFYVEIAPSDFLSTEMGLEHMFGLITDVTLVVFLLPLAVMAGNLANMFRLTMRGEGKPAIPLRFYLAYLKTLVTQALTHRTLRACRPPADPKRWNKHWLLAFGFVLMSVILMFFLPWFQTDSLYPLYHPQRWLGYLAAAALIVGPVDMIIARIRKRDEQHKFSEASDITLPVMLVLVAVTGILVHLFRYEGLTMACHYTYAVHMAIAVPMLLIEMPFGKMSHAFYRPFALYFQAVRDAADAATGAEQNSMKEIAA